MTILTSSELSAGTDPIILFAQPKRKHGAAPNGNSTSQSRCSGLVMAYLHEEKQLAMYYSHV